jgi:hypothetical protein
MKDFLAIFLNTYKHKDSWIVIVFAVLCTLFSFAVAWWAGLISIVAWVVFVPSVIWLIERSVK